MKQKVLVRGLVAAGIVTAALAGYSQLGLSLPGVAQANPTPAAAAAGESAATVTLPSFSTIARQYGPAVVNISVTGDAKAAAAPNMPQLDPNDPFYDFFKRFNGPMPQMPQGEAPPVHGQGSGFIVNKDGMILTNAHVVDGAKEVDVKLTDKREFKAKVLGVDKQTDVAVLKIEAHDLPVVKLGDPKESNVGDWVLAIGSPFGFENTVTAGIISAKARALPEETYVPFIQTDVAVNPGNSGGPLFNMKGEVIGINSQIFSRTGGYQGLSFSIPIDVAVKVQDQLVQHGKVTRGRIGVVIQGVNQALADSFGLKEPAGALVSQVEKGGPADKAGIQAGDIIAKLNGKPVKDSSELPARDRRRQAGRLGPPGDRSQGRYAEHRGHRRRDQGRQGRSQEQRSGRTGQAWAGGASSGAGRAEAGRCRRRAGGRGSCRAGGAGWYPAGRRDPVAQRHAGEGRRAAARAGFQVGQARRPAGPARGSTHLRSGRPGMIGGGSIH